jgi:tRNA threonylcarbamoyl adenosine modification protein YeaZ
MPTTSVFGVPWLVLDTSLPVAVVGLVEPDDAKCAHEREAEQLEARQREAGDGVLAEVTLNETRRHAEALPAALDQVLRKARTTIENVDGIGVGLGPGSFIGVRTGLSLAKGLARSRGLPLVGLNTCHALLASAHGKQNEAILPVGRGFVIVDARRGERYVMPAVCTWEPSARTAGGAAGPFNASEHRADGVRAVAVEGSTRGRRVEVDGEPVAVADAVLDFAGCSFAVGDVRGLAVPPHVVVVECLGPSAFGLLQALRATDLRDAQAVLVPRYVRAPDAKLPAVDPAHLRWAVPGPERLP